MPRTGLLGGRMDCRRRCSELTVSFCVIAPAAIGPHSTPSRSLPRVVTTASSSPRGGRQLYYRPVNRDLQRLESVSRSPIFAQFSETLNGVPTLRAYNQQVGR